MLLPDYERYRQAFHSKETPFAYVDLDLFDANTDHIAVRAGNKRVRIASKSIRCRSLIRRILDRQPQVYQGIMCYSVREAVWLSEQGFDDLLVAYPDTNKEALLAAAGAVARGKRLYLMTDLPEHLQTLQNIAAETNTVLPVCLDLDMSSRIWGIYFGVRRSSLRRAEDLKGYVEMLRRCPNLRLEGLMGYEAQIAGLGDAAPGKGLMNGVIRLLKSHSLPEVTKRRQEAVEYLKNQGFNLKFVNGGGTGSMESTAREAVVTEIAAGSGFYSPLLFDAYKSFRHLPAAGFALSVVRRPAPGIYTCLGGGYVASGAVGPEKAPRPFLPQGSRLDKNEMAGEVQTPVLYTGNTPLDLGSPVFFRHAKAGELCEHFAHLHLLQGNSVIDTVPTYRGEGHCFLG